MFYRICFYDKNPSTRLSAGVYAENEDDARAVAVILLKRAYGVNVTPDRLTVVEIRALTSTTPTTT